MLIVPEARNAILRTSLAAVVAFVCAVGAVRTNRRWGRILLAVIAIPITLFVMFGIVVIWLIMQYGPR